MYISNDSINCHFIIKKRKQMGMKLKAHAPSELQCFFDAEATIFYLYKDILKSYTS